MVSYVCPFPTVQRTPSPPSENRCQPQRDEPEEGGLLDLAAFMEAEDVDGGGDGRGLFYSSTTIKKTADLPFQQRPGRQRRSPPLSQCNQTTKSNPFPSLRPSAFKTAFFTRLKPAHRRANARPDSLVDLANQLHSAPSSTTPFPRAPASVRSGTSGTSGMLFSHKRTSISTASSTSPAASVLSLTAASLDTEMTVPSRRSSLAPPFPSVFPGRKAQTAYVRDDDAAIAVALLQEMEAELVGLAL
ncbi:hypothetical protein JCM10213_001031 [Rhodosporidiobolus nylandii]